MAYIVTIKKIQTTQLKVNNAVSKAHARRIVKDYGLTEAVSDFEVIAEDMDEMISTVTEY